MPNDLIVAANPLVPMPSNVMELMERTQLDTQIATARKFPRALVRQLQGQMIERATQSVEYAARCYYTLKRHDRRSNKDVFFSGPSVKLAQIATTVFGNIRAGAYMLANDGKTVTVRGECWDLETNNRQFTDDVRRIVDREGRPYSEDMQIQVAKAGFAIARRNAIFLVIDESIYWPVYQECTRIVAGTASELGARLENAFAWFEGKNVPRAKVMAYLEKEPGALTQDDLVVLQGMATAVKDGDVSIEELFRAPDDAEIPIPKQTFRQKMQKLHSKRTKPPEKEEEQP